MPVSTVLSILRHTVDPASFVFCARLCSLSECLDVAVHHQVLGLVGPRLLETESDESNARKTLTSHLRYYASHALAMVAELTLLAKVFNSARVRWTSYKGPVLAKRLYGDFASRHSVDLDVLIHPDDLVQCWETLHTLGYEPLYKIDRRVHDLFCQNAYEAVWVHRQRRVTLDVHWAIAARSLPFGLSLASPELFSETIEIGGIEVPMLSPVANALALSIHGSKHGWQKLLWIADIARLVRNHPEADWSLLAANAKRVGALRMVQLGLRLAWGLFNIPPPNDPLLRTTDSTVHLLTLLALDPILARRTSPSFPMFLTCLPNNRLRRDALAQHFWRPTPLDLEAIPLPSRLQFTYPLIRMGRVAIKHVFHLEGRPWTRPRLADSPVPMSTDATS